MKKILTATVLAASMMMGMSSCNDFFDSVPGVVLDMDYTFTNRDKTEAFLTDVYSYIPDETRERYGDDARRGIWTGASIEGKYNWDWQSSNGWNLGTTNSASALVEKWYIGYYKAIANASRFIENVDRCIEVPEKERTVWKAEARALRAIYYFYLFRLYGPVPMLGEASIPTDADLGELLRERNSVDECVDFIVTELDKAAADLDAKRTGNNYGRIGSGICKAMKAKVLLYAASPLFNGDADYADLKNTDGRNLFPVSADPRKWEKAKQAYEDFFSAFVPGTYKLYEETVDGKLDPYGSYWKATCGYEYTDELIFVRIVNHTDRTYEQTPTHKHIDDSSAKGGMGHCTTQQMVDLFFTHKGLRIDDDTDYDVYEGVPDASHYGSEDCFDEIVPSRNYYKQNSDKVLKQWQNREPRFYACITFNGSTWVNDQTNYGYITTELNMNGNSGYAQSGWDAPYSGYGIRKGAPKRGTWIGEHFATLLRLADMYLGYAECLSACGEYDKAMEQVNKIRHRAGIPEYGVGKDNNGFDRISYEQNRVQVDNRIRRERLIELCYEWNHYFDVRRWKVADMATGDGWIYPAWHKGGEGGQMIGMNYRSDIPGFFEKMSFENRLVEKKHYFFPIPDAEIRRNALMVQNPGWAAEN